MIAMNQHHVFKSKSVSTTWSHRHVLDATPIWFALSRPTAITFSRSLRYLASIGESGTEDENNNGIHDCQEAAEQQDNLVAEHLVAVDMAQAVGEEAAHDKSHTVHGVPVTRPQSLFAPAPPHLRDSNAARRDHGSERPEHEAHPEQGLEVGYAPRSKGRTQRSIRRRTAFSSSVVKDDPPSAWFARKSVALSRAILWWARYGQAQE